MDVARNRTMDRLQWKDGIVDFRTNLLCRWETGWLREKSGLYDAARVNQSSCRALLQKPLHTALMTECVAGSPPRPFSAKGTKGLNKSARERRRALLSLTILPWGFGSVSVSNFAELTSTHQSESKRFCAIQSQNNCSLCREAICWYYLLLLPRLQSTQIGASRDFHTRRTANDDRVQPSRDWRGNGHSQRFSDINKKITATLKITVITCC